MFVNLLQERRTGSYVDARLHLTSFRTDLPSKRQFTAWQTEAQSGSLPSFAGTSTRDPATHYTLFMRTEAEIIIYVCGRPS